MFFPTVRGQSLDGRSVTIPYSLAGEFNVLLVLFEPTHQFAVQTWLKPLKNIRKQYKRVRFYEVPTLGIMSPEDQAAQDRILKQSVVLEDQLSLETVVTIYVQKERFEGLLDIPHEDNLYVFLVDTAGVVLWRTEGNANPHKVNELTALLDNMTPLDEPWWMNE